MMRKRGRLAFAALLLVVAGLAAGGVVAMQHVRSTVEESRESITTLRESVVGTLTENSPATGTLPAAPAVAETIRLACVQAEQIDRSLGPLPAIAAAAGPASELLARLPAVGTQAGGTLSVAAAASETFGALRDSCEALETVVSSGTDLPSLLATLGGSRDALRASANRLRAAHSRLATIDERTLDDSSRSLVLLLRDRLPTLGGRLALLAELPELLGQDSPRTYLILGQNSDELRPTGGFIGTSGAVTLSKGRVVEHSFGPSLLHNPGPDLQVAPPEELRRHMGAAYWRFSESNWAPDFPTAARQALYFYKLLDRPPVDGVIAVNHQITPLLLELTGPVTVPGFEGEVTAANVRDRFEHHVHRPDVLDEDEEIRKRFVSALFSTVLENLKGLGASQPRELAAILSRALDDQLIQIWSSDASTQQALAELAWHGGLMAAPGDFLYAVNSNLGKNKINSHVGQELSYSVSKSEDGRLVGSATIKLINRYSPERPYAYESPDYRDHLRLLVPAQSTLLTASGFDSADPPVEACGYSTFGGLVTVRAGEERVIEVAYRLPARLTAERYELTVQKQPGVEHHRFRAELLGRELTPPNFFLASAHRVTASGGARGLVASGATPTHSRPDAACPVFEQAPRRLAPPGEIQIPTLRITAPFVGLGIDSDGTMVAPSTGDVVGWYTGSARPGQVGNFIASGHLDWELRPAVFWRLKELKRGDRVEVTAEGGERFSYEVQWVRQVNAANAPLKEIIGGTTGRWMTLITCGGRFDPSTRSYEDRLVVRAVAVSDSGRG